MDSLFVMCKKCSGHRVLFDLVIDEPVECDLCSGAGFTPIDCSAERLAMLERIAMFSKAYFAQLDQDRFERSLSLLNEARERNNCGSSKGRSGRR